MTHWMTRTLTRTTLAAAAAVFTVSAWAQFNANMTQMQVMQEMTRQVIAGHSIEQVIAQAQKAGLSATLVAQSSLALAPNNRTLAALAAAYKTDPAALKAILAVAVTVPALGTADQVASTMAVAAGVPVASLTGGPAPVAETQPKTATDPTMGLTIGGTLTSGGGTAGASCGASCS
ncbi:MAG: hypothetical protein ACKOXQ_07825 [Hydrogenophaga sp.]